VASWYVWSGAGGAGTGADWANAFTTVSAALTAGSAGDTYYVASDHAQTQASALTITLKGSLTNYDKFFSVNRAGSVPPSLPTDLLVGASIATTGAFQLTVSGAGRGYFSGFTFSAGSGAVSSILIFGPSALKLENCALKKLGTVGSSNAITFNGPEPVELVNTTVQFGSTSDNLRIDPQVRWLNTPSAIQGATIPTTLFVRQAVNEMVVSGVDLSALGSNTLVTNFTGGNIFFVNCTVGATVVLSATPSSNSFSSIQLLGCNNTTNVERNETVSFRGNLTTETTIVRTSGASDGTTAYSHKITTNTNPQPAAPFEIFEGMMWNSVTGASKTLTVHCVNDGVTLQDADIWVEAQYLGSSASPIATLVSSSTVFPTTPTNLSTESGAWTTTGLTSPVQQKFSVTFTPQMAGLIRWKVKIVKVSTTVYVCPKADLS
jgi:hypothetical protein